MKKNIILLFIIAFTSALSAQVGINTEAPNKLTELDVQNIVNGSDTIPKGIVIPRIRTAQRDRIDMSDTKLGNGVLIYNIDEDCFNYYNRQAGEWQSLCGMESKAVFNISDCSSIKVSGQYQNNVSLNSDNYIKLTVNVQKAGQYTIIGTPDPANGYYFTAAGSFFSTGKFDIILQGLGSPNKFTPAGNQGDLIKFNLNGVESDCSTYIKIEDSSVKPAYTMDCSTAIVNGVYKVNTALNATNNITLTLTATPAALGSTYIIKTNTVEGISFYGSGIVTALTQVVTLTGSGTPTSVTPKVMTVVSNSSIDVSTCSVTVTVALTKKKILSIGTYANNSYGYNFSGTNTNSNKLLTAASNFGTLPNSVVKIEGIEFIRTGDFIPSSAQLKTELDKNPDIVIIGVWWNLDATSAQYLVDYLSRGGVVLAFMEESGARRILQTLFGDESVTATPGGSPGAIYRYSYVNDDILNGPFGDIRGMHWGEDASQTLYVSGIPAGTVTAYSTDTNMSAATPAGTGKTTAFRHNTLNLVFVGDGGFNSGTNMAPTSPTICPFNINASAYPIPKTNYGMNASYRFTVYNSIFTANALAWAFKQAQFSKK